MKSAGRRTCHAGRHECGEHEKEHSEEQTAGIVVDLGRLVADVHIEDADEDANCQVRYQTQSRQRLHTNTHHQHRGNRILRTIRDTSVAYSSLDSSPIGFHVVYALIRLYNTCTARIA